LGIRLKKLNLPTEPEIDALDPPQLRVLMKQWRSQLELYQERLFKAERKIFGRSSERSGKEDGGTSQPTPPTPRGETTKQLSERYPEATVEVEGIDFPGPQACPACGSGMTDSGMKEISEYLDVREKEFIVVQQERHKHRCHKCHGAIVTAPAPKRVIPSGSYSDDLIVDAALSKYCDLIPMERYSRMAERGGLPGIPPHSLIQATFKLADFLFCIYELIKKEVLQARVLLADETPHRMLEGDPKERWYLWAFSSKLAIYFECHDTRSGDVSSELLLESICQFLVSDAYSGYSKSIRIANKTRQELGHMPIIASYCNAHARRRFESPRSMDPGDVNPDAEWMVDRYDKIYELERKTKGLTDPEILQIRAEMKPIFESMKKEAELKIGTYSEKSQMGSGYGYFLKYYDGLTLFLENPELPIDNNSSERGLRNPVVGRKTWYGTHSRAGARKAAIHFTIVESCKLNRVNPREFYRDAIRRIHSGRELLTPSQYKALISTNTC
jgi:transposase